MRKIHIITSITLLLILVGLGACKQEPVTSTLTTTIIGPTQTITATSTSTAEAQTVTVTETQSITVNKTITQTFTSTTTSLATTQTTTQIFDPSGIVVEVINDSVLTHEKCKITSPDGNSLLITGRIYNTTFSAHVAVISCTFFDENEIEIGVSEEINVSTVGIGSIDNFSIVYSANNLAQITKCVITITI